MASSEVIRVLQVHQMFIHVHIQSYAMIGCVLCFSLQIWTIRGTLFYLVGLYGRDSVSVQDDTCFPFPICILTIKVYGPIVLFPENKSMIINYTTLIQPLNTICFIRTKTNVNWLKIGSTAWNNKKVDTMFFREYIASLYGSSEQLSWRCAAHIIDICSFSGKSHCGCFRACALWSTPIHNKPKLKDSSTNSAPTTCRLNRGGSGRLRTINRLRSPELLQRRTTA